MNIIRTCLQDVRFAARLLLKDRSFAITALLTLAICIGANTAIFSIVRSVLLKPLPVPGADRIMLVYNSYPNAGSDRGGAGVPDYYDRVRDASAFQDQALYQRSGVTLGRLGGVQRIDGVRTTPSFFRVVEVRPELGRVFTEEDGEVGKETKAILSYGLWQRQYGGDRNIVGRDIQLGGVAYSIVGVMPRDFRFIWNSVDIWLPLAFTAEQKSDDRRHNNSWSQIGRLKPGATLQQAQAQIDAINVRNDERFPAFRKILHDAGFHTVVVPLQADLVREIRPVLYLLWGGVLFVLLIGCVNIANLVLVRSSGRRREMATRHAIGADLARLGRQLLTETTMLALMGGAIGLLVGWWALRAVTFLHLDELPRGHEIQLDPVSAAAILSLAVVVGLLIGAVPVARLARMNVNSALREEGRGGTSSRGTNLVRRSLATAQIAIAFVLLIGAGLLVVSFRSVLRIDPGFQPEGVITTAISLPRAAYKDDASVVGFTSRALEQIRALPGVEAAGVTDSIPFGDDYSDSVILAEGYHMQPGESLISPFEIDASDGYFEAMRIPLLRGRFFTASDTATSPKVAVIDERLAAKFWPGRDAVGRRLYKPDSAKDVLAVGPNTKYITVVGVVKEVQLTGLASNDRKVGAYYFPATQQPSHGMIVAVRTRGTPEALVESIRKTIAAIDPSLPLFDTHTMAERLDSSLVSRRVPMLLAAGFGIVALLLSAIGIYGVLAYGVAQRRREIGIRMALGSTARDVFGLVLGDGAKIIGVGLALGLAGSYVAGRAMKGLLYGVQPMDPRVLGVVAITLATVALLATMIPARRAAKVNPLVALNDN
jgi:predicted permease